MWPLRFIVGGSLGRVHRVRPARVFRIYLMGSSSWKVVVQDLLLLKKRKTTDTGQKPSSMTFYFYKQQTTQDVDSENPAGRQFSITATITTDPRLKPSGMTTKRCSFYCWSFIGWWHYKKSVALLIKGARTICRLQGAARSVSSSRSVFIRDLVVIIVIPECRSRESVFAVVVPLRKDRSPNPEGRKFPGDGTTTQ